MVDVAFQPNRVAGAEGCANAPVADRNETEIHRGVSQTLPLILLIAILVIYPALYSLHLATLNKSMQRFVGIGNFEFLFKRETFGWS